MLHYEPPILAEMRELAKKNPLNVRLDGITKDFSKSIQQFAVSHQAHKKQLPLTLRGQLVCASLGSTALSHSANTHLDIPIKTPFVVRNSHIHLYNISADGILRDNIARIEGLLSGYLRRTKSISQGQGRSKHPTPPPSSVRRKSEFFIRENIYHQSSSRDKIVQIMIAPNSTEDVNGIRKESKDLVSATWTTTYHRLSLSRDSFATGVDCMDALMVNPNYIPNSTMSPLSFKVSATLDKSKEEANESQKVMKELVENNAIISAKYEGEKTVFYAGLWDIELTKLRMVKLKSISHHGLGSGNEQSRMNTLPNTTDETEILEAEGKSEVLEEPYTIHRVSISVNPKYKESVSNALFRQVRSESSLFDEILASLIDYLRTVDTFSRQALPPPQQQRSSTDDAHGASKRVRVE